jgi:hypothetical protein
MQLQRPQSPTASDAPILNFKVCLLLNIFIITLLAADAFKSHSAAKVFGATLSINFLRAAFIDKVKMEDNYGPLSASPLLLAIQISTRAEASKETIKPVNAYVPGFAFLK